MWIFLLCLHVQIVRTTMADGTVHQVVPPLKSLLQSYEEENAFNDI